MLCCRHLFFCILLATLCLHSSKAAYFDGCDHTFNLNAGTSYLESPYYPNYYPPNTSCRYKFIAPLDYYIEIKCTLDMYANNNQCTSENLYIDLDGDIQMRGSERVCGIGDITRTSAFRSVVFAYISGNNPGRFRCTLTAKPQACDCGWSASTRIVNGQAAGLNEYPGMVALVDRTTNKQFCGATIVSHRHALTAAHCTAVTTAGNIVMVAGTNDLANPTSSKYYATYYVQQIIVHEQYQSSPNTINDIAVLVTTTNIEWSRGVGPMCLPTTTSDLSYSYVDVIGFGTIFFAGPTSSTLLKIQLMVITNQNCQAEYQGEAEITAGQMCTYDYLNQKRDSCQYDSGGPAIYRSGREFLVGIISFGKDCAGSSTVGVNTRVTYYMDWIRQKIGYTNCVVAMS